MSRLLMGKGEGKKKERREGPRRPHPGSRKEARGNDWLDNCWQGGKKGRLRKFGRHKKRAT